MATLPTIIRNIRACTVCEKFLPLGPNPILRANQDARIAIIGQAPGKRVHDSGVPWNDPSGERLRDWLGVTHDEFFDRKTFAFVPMGFCYPGSGKSGDLPPRKECAELWHASVLNAMPRIKLFILLSQYSHAYYLGDRRKKNLTETVKAWKEYQPHYFPLPHPSPRNNIWLKKNPWFEKNLLPQLRRQLRKTLNLGPNLAR